VGGSSDPAECLREGVVDARKERTDVDGVEVTRNNGTNQIEFIHVSEKALVAINVNLDETSKKTQQILLFGKENEVDEEYLEIFKKEALSRKISEENIKDLTEPDLNLRSEISTPRIHPKWEKLPHVYILGKFHMDPLLHHRDVECEVHQDSDIGSPTSSCTLDIDFLLEYPQPRQKKDHGSLKMKVLFLSLLLGVICAAQEEEAQPSLSELSGQWRTAYIASSNLGKIKPNGPFRVYLHKLLFDDEQGTVDFYFFVKHKGKWEYKHVSGIKQEDGTYAVDYEGKNVFEVSYVSNNILVAHNTNVDEHGKKTVLTGLFVKVNIEDESLQKFKELTQEKGIEEENVVNFIETDD
ncbi:PREDICTED: uncharacterized protein LOC104981863, partial [Bison bison bison]|uniref:Uncharacterized protein LOC104981863 n=1 Tax=Bison bison bison TaxID=43346 RepID=A0A6P3GSH0_BISBB